MKLQLRLSQEPVEAIFVFLHVKPYFSKHSMATASYLFSTGVTQTNGGFARYPWREVLKYFRTGCVAGAYRHDKELLLTAKLVFGAVIVVQ